MKTKYNRINLLIFLPFLLITIFYLIKVPIGQTPDEPAHLDYIKHLAYFNSLPNYTDSAVACHPPFYYLFLSPVYLLFKNIYILRIFSIIFSFLNLLVIKMIIDTIFVSSSSKRDLSAGTAFFCSLVPMYNFMSIAVNNDILACLLGSLLIYYSIISIKQGFIKKEYLNWSIVFIASIFTKVILWPAVFISGLTVFFTQKNQRKITCLVLALSSIGLLFWFYHNVSQYGNWDILGWKKLKEIQYFLTGNRLIYEQPRQWLVILFHSFWGIFGWFSIYLPLLVYSLLRKLSVLFIIPFVLFLINFFKTSEKKEKKSLLLFILFFIITFIALIRDNMDFFHPQGRYLFTVISIIGFYYTSSLLQISKFISNILFKSDRRIVFYLLLTIPLLMINVISLISVNNFYSK